MEGQNDSLELLHDVFAEIISETSDFPVDFDEAWQWIGYNKKQDGLIMLEKNFDEGTDFLRSGVRKTGKQGQPAALFMLTVDCFKSFCMLAQTERGKQVRRYYIRLEKELHVLGAEAVKERLDPATERKELTAQLKKDRVKAQELVSELEQINTYTDYRIIIERINRNENRLKTINKTTVTQLNWMAEQN